MPVPESKTPLPCPFCGGSPEMCFHASTTPARVMTGSGFDTYVRCNACEFDGPLVVGRDIDEAAAVAKWNRRVALPPPESQPEGLSGCFLLPSTMTQEEMAYIRLVHRPVRIPAQLEVMSNGATVIPYVAVTTIRVLPAPPIEPDPEPKTLWDHLLGDP